MLHDRPTAQILGEAFYQGGPCKHGHAGVRRVGSKACVDCGREYARTYWKAERLTDDQRAKRRARRNRAKSRRLEREPDYRAAEYHQRRVQRRADPEAVQARERRQIDQVLRSVETELDRERKHLARVQRHAERQARREACRHLPRAERLGAAVYARVRFRERLKQKTRRAVMRGARNKATLQQMALIRSLQSHACAYCGETENLHLDHKQPISRGGEHVVTNFQWLCGFHNMSKRDQTDAEYRSRYDIPRLTPRDAAATLISMAALP